MTTPEPTELPLTYAERATFGTCPICGARPGEKCHLFPFRVDGSDELTDDIVIDPITTIMTRVYVHNKRLRAAPTKKAVRYDVGGVI